LGVCLNLTPQISDNDLRVLEKISELLRYSAPVWLWQLCDSPWSQSRRTEQAVGATFPLRAKEDDIIRQLERMLAKPVSGFVGLLHFRAT